MSDNKNCDIEWHKTFVPELLYDGYSWDAVLKDKSGHIRIIGSGNIPSDAIRAYDKAFNNRKGCCSIID